MQYVALGGSRLPKDVPMNDANFMIHQVTTELPFEFEILFESGNCSVNVGFALIYTNED